MFKAILYFTALLVFAKLIGIIAISWLYVYLPLITFIVFIVLFFALYGFVMMFEEELTKKENEDD